MLAEFLLLALLALVLWSLYDNYVTGKNLPPGPTRLPFLGTIIQLALRAKEPPYLMLQKLSQEYGDMMTIKFGTLWQGMTDHKMPASSNCLA